MDNKTVNIKNLAYLCEVEEKSKLLHTLQEWGLIPQKGQYPCPKCGHQLSITSDSLRAEPWRWCCPGKVVIHKQKKRPCGTKVSFRTGTFFARSHLSLFQMLGFVNLWVSDISLGIIAEQIECSYKTAVDWAYLCRQTMLNATIDESHTLGGPGILVEIVPVELKDKPTFDCTRNARRHWVHGNWLFAGYERGTGRTFLVAVKDHTSATITDLILNWIHPGTTIICDSWKAYDCLDQEGYEHLTKNHSITFDDMVTDVHSNLIEGSGKAARAAIGLAPQRKFYIPYNLARYLFRKRCEELQLNHTIEFLRLAGQLHNPIRLSSPFDNCEYQVKKEEGEAAAPI